jgi:hypothetical protein
VDFEEFSDWWIKRTEEDIDQSDESDESDEEQEKQEEGRG